MAIRRATVAALLALGLAVAGTGCEPADNERAEAGSSPGPSTDPEASTSSGSASGSGSDSGSGSGSGSNGKDGDAQRGQLPRLTGQGLRSAQDAASQAGFKKLKTHDALGRDRAQAFTRNWQVCFQEPAPGAHATNTEVDLGVVKLREECPTDDNRPEKAGDTMPDFTGKSLRAARGALDSSTSITTKDATSRDRLIVLESNWQVCGQKPAAGRKLDGQPVSLTAVKFNETCP